MSWARMKRRCLNQNDISFSRYGAKGVRVCKSWLDFKNFLADMGGSYFQGASLERIDNKKGYSPENCKWIEKSEQGKNRSQCRFYEHNGIKDTIAGWEKRLNFKRGTLRRRLNYAGMSFEDAISEPLASGTHKYKNP